MTAALGIRGFFSSLHTLQLATKLAQQPHNRTGNQHTNVSCPILDTEGFDSSLGHVQIQLLLNQTQSILHNRTTSCEISRLISEAGEDMSKFCVGKKNISMISPELSRAHEQKLPCEQL